MLVTNESSLLTIPACESIAEIFEISIKDFSPTLITLSLIFLKSEFSTIASDPEKSIASFLIFSNLLDLILPLLKSMSIASDSTFL